MTVNEKGLEAALLPCPFCGGGETTFNNLTHGSGNVLTVRLVHHCGPDDWPCVEFSAPTKAEAIAAWNRRRILTAIEPVAASPGVPEPKLTAYETQVLIGTSISGCAMSPKTAFDLNDLKAAWKRLFDLGLIDRTDGLATATPKGRTRIEALLQTPEPNNGRG